MLQDIKNLGHKNEIKEVSDGFARNFLFPNNLAKPGTEDAVKEIEQSRAADIKKTENEASHFHNIAAILSKKHLTIGTKTGERGKAFGSVTAAKIMKELTKEKINVEKEWIDLKTPIKQTGEHKIKIKFPHNIEGTLQITVKHDNDKTAE